MDELTIYNKDGQLLADSREVAKMVEKDHKNLLRDIKGYIEILLSSNLSPVEFFIESTYQDSTGRELPRYLLTKKGCDMVANKMTGKKGVLFTAAYVSAFEKMREQLITQKPLQIPQSLPDALRLAADLAEKNAQLLDMTSKQAQLIGELKPKADYVDWILSSPSVVTMTAIAKDYGMSATSMNQLLHEKGIQYKQGEQWFLYHRYHDKGYTHSETVNIKHTDHRPDIKMHTKWTQKGRLFLYELLKADGILPMIERTFSA